MTQRRKFSTEYKREAVAMLTAPGVTVRQIAADLGIDATVLGRWRRELRREPEQTAISAGSVRRHLKPCRKIPKEVSGKPWEVHTTESGEIVIAEPN